jgi:hypothetical protein
MLQTNPRVVRLQPLPCQLCGRRQDPGRVQALHDQKTSKLGQLMVDVNKDGKPNVYSYMDGTKFLRIEIDQDEDGKIDRWEYYGPNQMIEKAGCLGRMTENKMPGPSRFRGSMSRRDATARSIA